MVSDSVGPEMRARRTGEEPRHLRLAPDMLAGRVPLPGQPTPLIGRAAEVAALRARLWQADLRLLTLVGPGGIGKTRLAIAAAAEVADDFADGVCFVDLAPLALPALVPDAICRALGLRGRAERTAMDQLRDVLRERDILLVLDNFEHLPAAARLVADLLTACPAVVVLATSRTPLRLRWGQHYRVAPLPVPALDGQTPAELAANPAVALFLERARAIVPTFEPSAEEGAAIAALCARLDGLPLAIEMAAAQVNVFSPRALLRRLTEQIDLLRSNQLDRPDRHRTLVATIAWSYDLLDPAARTLFRRLAVFADGCSPGAAAAVCGAAGESAGGTDAAGGAPPDGAISAEVVPDLLAILVDHSLLLVEEDHDGEPRFRMLATIREFATARLAESGEGRACWGRLVAYLLDQAELAAPELTGPGQIDRLQFLSRERDNYRAALTWTLAEVEAGPGLRLGAALWWFWYLRGDFREGREWLARLLDLPGEARSAGRAGCLVGAGTLAYQVGEQARARELGEAGLVLARALGHRDLICLALNLLGGVALWSGDTARARQRFEEATEQSRQRAAPRPPTPREQFGLSLSLTNLSVVVTALGDRPRAAALLEESLALTRRLGDRQGMAHAVMRLGDAVALLGEERRALPLFEEALALFGALGDQWGTARAQLALARLALARRDLAGAAAYLDESLRYFARAEVRLSLAFCWEVVAELALRRGRAERAAQLLGAAGALRVAIGAVPEAPEQAGRERLVAALERLPGAGHLAAAREVGAALTVEQAVEVARAELAAEATVTTTPPPPAATERAAREPLAVLTRRERELLPCLARGLSNRAIAAELNIGARTVEMHVANLLAKLGLSNRAQIAAWAAAHELEIRPRQGARRP